MKIRCELMEGRSGIKNERPRYYTGAICSRESQAKVKKICVMRKEERCGMRKRRDKQARQGQL